MSACRPLSFLIILVTLQFSCGCTAITMAGATAGAAVTVTGAAVRTTGAAVGAVIPDGDDDEDEYKD
ncbi:hypothetical protein N9E57_00335 [Gammaproteobacteria bacterium]|nr:hypothetical protein [Gammaproteobacteria bacterium]